MLSPENVTGTGKLHVAWTNQQLACAPFDAPMWCSEQEIGRYRIEATLFDRSDFSIVGRQSGVVPRIITKAASSAFAITGDPDLRRLEIYLTSLAHNYFGKKTGVLAAGGWIQPYIDNGLPMIESWTSWCRRFNLRSPFAGALSVCVPHYVVGDFGVDLKKLYDFDEDKSVSGRISYLPGVMSYAGASRTFASPTEYERMV